MDAVRCSTTSAARSRYMRAEAVAVQAASSEALVGVGAVTKAGTDLAFLYGTAWKELETQRLTEAAFAAGFRGIDTANQRKHYYEAGVGAALRASGLPRAEVFLQTKYTFERGQDERLPYDPSASFTEQVAQSFESSLEHLGTEYIDALLLHGPSTRPGLAEADWEVWRAIQRLAESGRVRHIGVSNVLPGQLRMLHEASEIKPSFVQNRCYSQQGWDREVRRFCAENGVVYQGFSLLTANRPLWQSDLLRVLAERHSATPAQVIFAFALQVGMLPLTGTTRSEHMKADLASVNIALSEQEMTAIESAVG